MTWMLALMKVYFSLLYVEWRKWMPKNVIECWLKWKNRYWIWFRRKVRFFALMNVSSRCWSPFHTNINAYFLVMNSKRCISTLKFVGFGRSIRFVIGMNDIFLICWQALAVIFYFPPSAKVSWFSCYPSVNRPFALRGHVTSFFWKWKLYDLAFKKWLVGHSLNKIIGI